MKPTRRLVRGSRTREMSPFTAPNSFVWTEGVTSIAYLNLTDCHGSETTLPRQVLTEGLKCKFAYVFA